MLARAGIVLCQRGAQPPGLHPYDRVRAGIERRFFIEDLNAKYVLFEGIPLPGKGLVDGELQESAQPVRASKKITHQDPVKLRPDLRFRYAVVPAGRRRVNWTTHV